MRQRVVVLADGIGELDPVRAGTALGRGWAESAQVALVPLASGGPALAQVLGWLWHSEPEFSPAGWQLYSDQGSGFGISEVGSVPARLLAPPSVPAGRSTPNGPLIVDLTNSARQVGAGFTLPGEVNFADLGWLRERYAETPLVGLVSADEAELGLLGLRGAIAEKAFAAGWDIAARLAADDGARAYLARLGVADQPGAGAAGGLGALVLALGGQVRGSLSWLAQTTELDRTVASADLVAVVCDEFHIGNQGGDVARFAASIAMAHSRPCVVFARHTEMGRREMRSIGVEAAHQVQPGPISAAIRKAASRAAAGWRG